MRVFLAALLFAAPVHAQDWVTPEVCTVEIAEIAPGVLEPPGLDALETAAAEIPNATGRLWRITSPDGAVSHLWGTMHSSDRLILDIPDEALSALRASRLLAVEIDYRFKNRAEIARSYEYEGWWLEDPDESVVLLPGSDPRIPGWIEDRLSALGMDGGQDYLTFGGMGEMILGDPCEDFTGGIPPIQDDYLLTLAHVAGIPIIGLEPSEAFVETLNDPENADMAQALVTAYGAYLYPVSSSAERAASFALYRQGRIGVMMAWDAGFLRSMLGPDAEMAIAMMNGYLIDERNVDFVDAARESLRGGGVFIAVGAFHLPGENGMIELLRADGYTVERVVLPGEVP